MQHAAHQESGRREERVPLEAFVELHSDESAEQLSADGMNVSNGGIAMRAAFVPPLGALLECRFACPPSGELVGALGEVVWSERTGPEEGQFGLRFLELDTKSATTLRRYVRPDEGRQAPKDRLRAATLHIDGLGAAVEAELKLADETRVVLEQQLTFLQLGRGVEVSVLGRGQERGRIASVELRQSNFDVPTLVFGILLDEAPERGAAAVPPGVAPLFSGPGTAPEEAPRHVWAREVGSGQPVYAEEVDEAAARANGHAYAAIADDLELPTRGVRWRRLLRRFGSRWAALARWFGSQSGRSSAPALTAGALDAQSSVSDAAARVSSGFDLPDVRTRLLLHVARARGVLLRGWSRMRRLPSLARAGARFDATGRRERLRQPPPLRVQRSTLPGAGPQPQHVPGWRRTRVAAAVVATAGLAVAAYALAPRTDAGLRTPGPLASQHALAEEGEDFAQLEADPATQASAAQADARAGGRARNDVAVPEDSPGPTAEGAMRSGAQTRARASTFGEPDVPNGRTFTLRMNGPVRNVEGQQREDGFTVRVPRRLSLDRASPIASAHRAVARAMILNRGGYAELTIDFVPGVKPRYQVVGRDNTLEVTLERL